MSTSDSEAIGTPQINAPRTTEQLVGGATSAHEIGYGRRSARGHGYELRGLAYVPVSRLHEGRFGRMFRLPPFVPSDQRIADIAAAMTEDVGGPSPELDNPRIPAGSICWAISTQISRSTAPCTALIITLNFCHKRGVGAARLERGWPAGLRWEPPHQPGPTCQGHAKFPCPAS
jgi:hypothetical protein